LNNYKKHHMVAIFRHSLLACLFLLALAIPSMGQTPVYNEYEVGKLRAFLDQPSAVAGKTNGVQLNPNYNPNNPSTFSGVTWSNDLINKQVLEIGWSQKELAGTLDLSDFTKLDTFLGYTNKIGSANFSGNSLLKYLFIGFNNLTYLNISGCTELRSLSCYYNDLVSVDLRSVNKITSLSLYGNKLSSIDLSNNTELVTLDLSYNKFSGINLSANTKLRGLTLSNNELTSIDLSMQTMLTSLYISNNRLFAIDLSNNTSLEYVICNGNAMKLSNLPIFSKLTSFTYAPQAQMIIGKDVTVDGIIVKNLNVDEVVDLSSELTLNGKTTTYVWRRISDGAVVTPTTSIDGKFTFGREFEGQGFYCEMSNEQFPDFVGNNKFRTCDIYIGSTVTKYNTDEVTKLKAFLNQPSSVAGKTNGQQVNDAYNPNDPSTFGVTWTTGLEKQVEGLYWSSKNLSGDLDLSNFTRLERVNVGFNQLKTVNVNSCAMLSSFLVRGNQLTSVDVSGCSQLSWFECQSNIWHR
jgi:hypothetical protein